MEGYQKNQRTHAGALVAGQHFLSQPVAISQNSSQIGASSVGSASRPARSQPADSLYLNNML